MLLYTITARYRAQLGRVLIELFIDCMKDKCVRYQVLSIFTYLNKAPHARGRLICAVFSFHFSFSIYSLYTTTQKGKLSIHFLHNGSNGHNLHLNQSQQRKFIIVWPCMHFAFKKIWQGREVFVRKVNLFCHVEESLV